MKSGLDIMSQCTMNFEFAPEHNEIMTQIYRIVQNRKYFDPQARRIAKDTLAEQCLQYGEDVFNRAIELGRFEPFNARYLSLICNYNRQNTYARWVLEPTREHYMLLMEDEKLIYENATRGIVDLRG